ncbi:hypothetical protein CEQ90_17310 [Lewinellaceae bacterium SD302]|nr:hypothetical protein CEQ90_17310 [Lewinellaceae bacterium SD302]
MPQRKRRLLFKIVLWTLGIVVGLVLLIFLALQLPATQRFITKKVEDIARTTLDTDVGIGHIDIDWLNAVTISDVYLNNPAGDSIARLGEISVDIDLWALTERTVEISSVGIRDIYAYVQTTDSSSNIQFLLDQFVTTDSNAVTSQEEVSANKVAVPDSTAGWQIAVENTELTLERADIFYQDDPTGLLADVDLAELKVKMNGINLDEQRYNINYADLRKGDIRFRQNTIVDTDTSTTAATAMELIAGRLTLEDITATVQLDEMDLNIGLPRVNLEGAELKMDEELAFIGEVFQLEEAVFSLDQPTVPQGGPAIDYEHLSLTGLTAEITDIAYIVDSLHLNIRQLEGKERSGLALRRTEGVVTYTPELLVLDDFLLRTAASELNSPATRVDYAFADSDADLENIIARLRLNGYVGLSDIAKFTPALNQVPLVRNNLGQRFTFAAEANGNGRDVRIDVLRLDGPGVKLRTTGNVKYPFDTARLAAVINILELDVRPGPVLPLLPDSLVPPDIDWPRRIVANGKIDYADDRVSMNLRALEDRPNPLDLMSRIRVNGWVDGLNTYPRTQVKIAADTLLATRSTILAYVPPNAIPEGYTIPDYLRASGTVEGPLENLDVDLRLNLPGDNTYAYINGRIRNALEPENLDLDIEVRDLSIAALDVNELLPDSLLPANFNLPDFNVRNARISGGLTNLAFELPLETSNGNWNLSGNYNPEDLNVNIDLQNFVLRDLFTGDLSDTLATLELQPLDLQATITGQLEPTMNLAISAQVEEEERGDLLSLEALVEENTYSGEFLVTHPDFQAEGAGLYSLGADSTAIAFVDVELDRVDLQRWDITELPLFLSGQLQFEAAGLDPYAMNADLILRDVLLRGDNGSSYVDSFYVNATLQDKQNEITIESDVLEANLNGRFDPLNVAGELERFFRGYYEEDIRQPEPFQNGNNLNFDLRVKRTRPLTGGLIAGLTELRPFSLHFDYRDAEPGMILEGTIPRIVYSGIEIDNLVLDAMGDRNKLNFDLDVVNFSLSDQLVLGKTHIGATNESGGILTELEVWNDNDSLRHRIAFLIDPETDSLTVEMEPEQILNFQPWSVPADNLIALAGPSLIVNNFALINGRQRLSAKTTEPGDVVIELSSFELGTIARLLNTEEQLFSGVVDGTVGLDNAVSNLGVQANLEVNEVTIYETPFGDLKANVSSENEQTYLIDVDLDDAGNKVRIDGTYELNGNMQLKADVAKLTLKSAEPFSLGYLKDAEGFISGTVNLTGTNAAPRMQGDLRFNDAALRISLLGERFRISNDPINFNGAEISIPGLKFYDSRDGVMNASGSVVLNSLENIELDLQASTDNFLALNSTSKDNDLYYGKMAAAASVDVSGTARLPIVVVDARPVGESEVTYVYTIPENNGRVQNRGVVTFVDAYEWQNIKRNDTIVSFDSLGGTGIDLTLNLDVTENLLVKVIVDPASGQTFQGRANGELVLRQFPDLRQEMTGRVELTEGKYDFIFQKIIRKEFLVLPGSNVVFNGDIENPLLDLRIRHEARTEPLPLVTALNPQVDPSGLRQRQTFYVDVNLTGDLLTSDIETDLTYPEDLLGNTGNPVIGSALSQLRQDESRLTKTAFSLLAFGSFNVPVLDSGSGNGLNGTLDNAMSQYLNGFADNLVGFVDIDFGLDSYQGADGSTNRNLRLSLRKTLFNDRVIISVDGVTGNDTDSATENGQTYLDNITAEFLIDEAGTLRLKFFNDRDRDVLVGGNVIRFGGRLVLAKDFERFFWSPKAKESD